MAHSRADVVAYIECRRSTLPMLLELAERVDRIAGEDPPEDGYGLAEAFCAVLNGGTAQDIQAALSTLNGWAFQPKGGSSR